MRESIALPFSPRNDHTVAVTLSDDVLARVAEFAERIELANRKRKRRNKQGMTAKGRDSLQLRVRGYAGEAALAQYLGLPPVRMADEWRAKPDVLCFDVLTTDKAHGSLIITPRDRLDMMKVLVVDRSPVFHLCGWYRAGDAREEAQRRHSEWWRTERESGGAWYIPQAYLRPLHYEEALQELKRFDRFWDGDRFRYVPEIRSVVEDAAANVGVPAGAMRRAVENAIYPATQPITAVDDWREVLRRAGAAPPEER